MSQDTIKCPKCGELIKLSEAISHDMEIAIKSKYEKKFENRLTEEKKIFYEKAKKDAAELVNLELVDLKEQVEEKNKKLEENQTKELELRKEKRILEEDKKAFELNMVRKMDLERQSIEEKISREVEDRFKLKDAEKNKQLSDMQKKIDDLNRIVEQRSQQMQGEALELEIEHMLRENFLFDEIVPVSKGIKGGDVIHTVKTQSGRVCGRILWETKRTKNWSDAWIPKLKDDQREIKADLSVLVSEVLPQGLHHFKQIENVWVSDIESSLSLAIALRAILIQVARANEIQIGKEEKMEIVYNYLTGVEFRNRIQSIVESFVAMKRDLDSEKRAMAKNWAQREKQIERITINIAGMHGDLEGIVGNSLPAVKILELSDGEEDKEE